MNNEANTHSLVLDTFNGPLVFLLQLIQKKEISLSDVTLRVVAEQVKEWISSASQLNVNESGEFVATTASLIWLKSKWLLPNEQAEELEEEEDPFLTLIPDLIDYCQFKQMAKTLGTKEGARLGHYPRPRMPLPEIPTDVPFKGTAEIESLTQALQNALERSKGQVGEIFEENWLVSDKIEWLTKEIHERSIGINELFHSERAQGELIVFFLAILELMKIGTLQLIKNEENLTLEAQ